MEMFQDFLPEKVHVKLENSHMATDLVLWLGDKVLNRFPLNGTETEVEIPVKLGRLSKFFEPKVGESARATAVWLEFRPKISEYLKVVVNPLSVLQQKASLIDSDDLMCCKEIFSGLNLSKFLISIAILVLKIFLSNDFTYFLL